MNTERLYYLIHIKNYLYVRLYQYCENLRNFNIILNLFYIFSSYILKVSKMYYNYYTYRFNIFNVIAFLN